MKQPVVPYVVRQGDYLAKIAHALGFHLEEVWNDPRNAELKARRDPNILHPGDLLYVPSPAPPPLAISGGTSNDYAATIPTTTIKLVFNGVDGPLANEPYVLEGLSGEPVQGTTDGSGTVTFDVAVHLRECQITFTGPNIVYPIAIGEMDPIEEPSGVRKRLQHLGYGVDVEDETSGDMTTEAQDAYDQLAITSFQHDHQLTITGAMNDETRAALLEAHGS